MIKINPSSVKLANLSADDKQKLLDDFLVYNDARDVPCYTARYYNSNDIDSLWFSEARHNLREGKRPITIKARESLNTIAPEKPTITTF